MRLTYVTLSLSLVLIVSQRGGVITERKKKRRYYSLFLFSSYYNKNLFFWWNWFPKGHSRAIRIHGKLLPLGYNIRKYKRRRKCYRNIFCCYLNTTTLCGAHTIYKYAFIISDCLANILYTMYYKPRGHEVKTILSRIFIPHLFFSLFSPRAMPTIIYARVCIHRIAIITSLS